MELSVELLSQFAKIVGSDKSKKTETTVYGTTVEYDGSMYVKLDGSDLLTPISSTADTKPDERVTVMIKNHTATITGNMSSPAARVADVSSANDNITKLQADNVIIKSSLTAANADISNLKTDTASIKTSLTATNADITNLKADNVSIKSSLSTTNADITNLKTDNATIKETLTAADASIKKLETDKLSAKDLEGKYANIDFSNIGKAAIEYFFTKSGLIDNLVVGDETITGELVGVTIKGDLIEGNTIKAEKLVVRGTNGLYYKLNTDGMTTEAEQTNENSLNGSIITAKSITASKISVKDLVAFDATIGGFNITESAIYSGVKESVDNTTQGIYLDKDGQMVVGDASNFLKYYKDAEGNYKLEISANSVILGTSGESVETAITNAQTSADNARSTADETGSRVTAAETLLQLLADSISMLVTDGNGESLMTQTENGWTFSTGQIQDTIDTTSENLNALTNTVGDVSSTVGILQQAVDDLGILSEYVKITTYEDEPCIELGETDSDFKLLITNTRIMFMEGTGVPAYINNQSLYIRKAVVEEELQQGEFIWKARSNGNLGLIWKGVTS